MPGRQRQKMMQAAHQGRRRLRKMRAREADRLDEANNELGDRRERLGDAVTEGVGEIRDSGVAAATELQVRARQVARKRVLAVMAIAGVGAVAAMLMRSTSAGSDGDRRRGA